MRLRPQLAAPGSCRTGTPCLSGAGQPRSAVWVGPSSIIGADASPTSAPLSPRPPAPPLQGDPGRGKASASPSPPMLMPKSPGCLFCESLPFVGLGPAGRAQKRAVEEQNLGRHHSLL